MLRKITPIITDYYQIEVIKSDQHSPKSFKISTQSGKIYFLKNTTANAGEKYQFLSNQGINNVLYPILNRDRQFVTKVDENAFYLSDYVDNNYFVDEVKVVNMYRELHNLHLQTAFKRQLSSNTARPKFEEITRQLEFKFKNLEQFIRSVEMRKLSTYSMPILANYQHILNAKKELIRLQKRIISSIKERESVDYAYVHNNPKLDHLLVFRGSKYLTSLENGKIGISSLDMAKFYVENAHLNVDFKSLIIDYYQNENDFYYDYFRFLVLFIYIKRIIIQDLDYISAQSFITNAKCIHRCYELFSDKKDETDK